MSTAERKDETFHPPEEAIRSHLDLILASPPFESSRRSRELLSYLVDKTLRGEGAQIKERSLGEDVFGRPGYEPSEQNLVRVAANELRKRLAQFYESHPDEELHLELPKGSYAPVFRTREKPAAMPAAEPKAPPAANRLPNWFLAAGAALALAALSYWVWARRPSPEEAFWRPVLSSGKTALIWATGWGAVMTEQTRDEILRHEKDTLPYTLLLRPDDVYPVDQMISFGHVHGIGSIMSWLGQRGRPAELRLGNWSMPTDAQDRPLIAFGALNNPWTIAINRDLRFRVVSYQGQYAVVEQQQPGRRWTMEWRRRGYDQDMDYGVITRIIDPDSGQARISIGGICNYSSQAAAEFLTSPRYWAAIGQTAPPGWERMNLQVVLEVKVVAKVPQSPKAVAWHFW